jgi:hypothetical protein
LSVEPIGLQDFRRHHGQTADTDTLLPERPGYHMAANPEPDAQLPKRSPSLVAGDGFFYLV